MKILNFEQGSAEWLDARKGVITGTYLKKIMGRDVSKIAYDLIGQQISPLRPYATVGAMEWGTEHEDMAVEAYEAETGIITQKVDFCVHSKRHWHGLSPDRLVSEKKKFVGGVEVKCPEVTAHLYYMDTNKIPTEYKWQFVNYFLVNTDQQWLDFVSYCPDIEKKELRLHIRRIERKELEDDIAKADEKLLAFREKWEEIESKLLF